MHVFSLCVGVYEVGVHIADVSYFVKEGTALDQVASERATSVYLVQKVSELQWNLSNPDTLGAEESVLISEVSWFLGLNCTQT